MIRLSNGGSVELAFARRMVSELSGDAKADATQLLGQLTQKRGNMSSWARVSADFISGEGKFWNVNNFR